MSVDHGLATLLFPCYHMWNSGILLSTDSKTINNSISDFKFGTQAITVPENHLQG
jgi:hypothetical protein